MRNLLLNLIFLFVMVGCTQPTIDKVQRCVEKYAKSLIDSGMIANKYVVLYELATNDSNCIYQIQASDYPAWGLDYPSRIVRYKDRYFCFIEIDESPMLVDDIIKQTGYSGNFNSEGGGGETWILVVSKSGEKRKMIDISQLEPGWITYFNITELWPYFSGYVKGGAVQMGIMSHHVELNDGSFLSCNIDSIRQRIFWDGELRGTMIKDIYGKMYMKNNTDSTVCVSAKTMKHYAIVDNHDSLYLSLCDSLPVVLKPEEYKIIEYKSLPGQGTFFKNIASEKDCWEYFHRLFCNSAYCLMDVNGESMQKKIMFHDIDNYEFYVHSNCYPQICFRILLHGTYDKKDMEMSNFKFWSDKWDSLDSVERTRIWNETEENFQRNVERIRKRKEKGCR